MAVSLAVQSETDHQFLECVLQELLWEMRLKFQKLIIPLLKE